MSHKRSASSVSASSSSSSASSNGSSRVPVPSNGVPHFFIEWCKHADRHFATQAQFAEMLKLIKDIHSQLCRTDEVSRRQTMTFFINKVRKIYFDHAVWENGERARLEIEGLAELKKQHAGARISKDAMMWIAGSLTAVLTTQRGPLRQKLTQLILCDFEQHSPRLSTTKYKALLAQDKDLRKELVRKSIHGINEYLYDDNDRPADTETHSARAFKFWYNWIRDGCEPGANSQDSCMFRSIEKKYGKTTKPMEDENNLDVGNTTSGEGSTETESRGHEKDGYDKRGFDFGGYSSELSRAIENSVETRHSSPSLDEDVEVSSSNEDESQQGRATQMDIRKMIDDIKKNDEREVKEKERERKKEDRVAKKKAEQEARRKERERKGKERERKGKEREEIKKAEREAKEKERKEKKKKGNAEDEKRRNLASEKKPDDSDHNETQAEEEEEKKRNNDGQTGKRTAKVVSKTKSTEADKKRKVCEEESKQQPVRKRRAVAKPERTVTRSLAKKMKQVPDAPVKQDTHLSERVWTVSLEALELANSFESVIEDTASEALKRLPVPNEFHGLARLRDSLIQELGADGADWGGDDDNALYLLYSKEDGKKAGGTTVHLGFEL